MTKFPYKFKHVSVFKRGNRCAESDPWIMAWVDPVTQKKKYKTLGVDDLRSARRARLTSKYVVAVLAGHYSPSKAKIDAARLADVFVLLRKFRKALAARGVTKHHVITTYKRCRRILRRMEAKTYEDLSPSRVQEAVAMLRDLRKAKPRPFLSASSRNQYMSAVKEFVQWLKDNDYAQTNWLENKLRIFKGDPTHERRAVSIEQLQDIIAAAERGPIKCKVLGKERALIYRTCAITGIRANEARTLRVNDLSLDGAEPFIHLRISNAKARKERFQPIPIWLADMLRRHVFGRDPHARVFHVPHQAAAMMKFDLAAAGVDYFDGKAYFDFHGLRVQCATMAIEGGATPKTVMETLGHASLAMTLKYMKNSRPKMDAKREAMESISKGLTGSDISPPSENPLPIKNSA